MKLITRLSLIVALAPLPGLALAASQINSLPPVTFPLIDPGNPSTSTENLWISKGTADFRITPTQLGYQFQGASAPTSPFAQQFWWNTTTAAAPIHSIYTGSAWVRSGTLDKTNGIWVPPVGGGTATLANSGTVDLGSVPQAAVTISGSGAISSFGTSAVIGTIKFLTFSGASTLTYNASSMILPSGASITAAANDTAIFEYLGSGNWRALSYAPFSGGVPNLPNADLLGASGGDFTVVTVGSGLAIGGGTLTAAPPSANLLGGTGSAYTTVAVGTGLTLAGGTLSDNPAKTSTTVPVSSLNSLYFPTYSQLAGYGFKLALSGAISDASGSFRDTAYFESTDSDVTGYASSHTNYAGRFASFGPNTAGVWSSGRKNIIGLSAYSKGATSSAALGDGSIPGIGGVSGEAIQYNTGLASNEFAAHNPSAAGGSLGQSVSMAAVQGIIDQSFADVDASHTAYAFLATNTGAQLATAAYGASGTAQYQTFLDGGTAVVTTQAIVMPHSSAGFAGTVINYGLNNGNPAGGSWTDWLGTTNGGQYRWVDGGVVIATLDTTGSQVHPVAAANAFAASPISGTGNLAFVATGAWTDGLNLNSATFTDAAIVLNTTAAGSAIKYDANNFTRLNAGTYEIFLNGSARASVSAAGLTTLSSLTAGTTILGATTATGLTVTPSVASLNSLVVTQGSPAAAAACTAGQIITDTGFFYACTASGVWKRVAIVGGY